MIFITIIFENTSYYELIREQIKSILLILLINVYACLNTGTFSDFCRRN